MKIQYEELVNSDGQGYGWDYTVTLDSEETYEAGKRAMMEHAGLDYDDDDDNDFVEAYGDGVWNQFRWRIV